MRPVIPIFAVMATLLMVGACGGGGGGGDAPQPVATPEVGPPVPSDPVDPNSPHLTIEAEGGRSFTLVGGGVPQSFTHDEGYRSLDHYLTTNQAHGNADVYQGTARNGTSREQLSDLLAHDARDGGLFFRRFGDNPPVIRLTDYVRNQHAVDVITAVNLINDSLPRDYQLQISPQTVEDDTPAYGEIVVAFLPARDWSGCGNHGLGCARTRANSQGEIENATVWIDFTQVEERNRRIFVLVHEFLHTLGRPHADANRFPDSTVVAVPTMTIGMLYQLDRDALFAVYDRIEVGTPSTSVIYSDLGPWEDTSDVLLGYVATPSGDVEFGVASRNGLAQPWATGPTPDMALSDNRELQGNVTWAGRMLGFTPGNETVGASADLSLTLTTLRGRLDFTDMEQWADGVTVGAVGSGTMWGDGDLTYPIMVLGNTFAQTRGGDRGLVEGAFMGLAHEGMGGTLRRDDLTAAFGGER